VQVNRGYAMPSVRAPPALEGVLVYLGGVDDLLDDLRRTDEKLSGGDVDRVLEYAARYVIGIPAPALVLDPLYHRPAMITTSTLTATLLRASRKRRGPRPSLLHAAAHRAQLEVLRYLCDTYPFYR